MAGVFTCSESDKKALVLTGTRSLCTDSDNTTVHELLAIAMVEWNRIPVINVTRQVQSMSKRCQECRAGRG